MSRSPPWERGLIPPSPPVVVPAPPVVGAVPLPPSGVAGAQAAAATQASLPITPSIADKITSGAIWATNTGLTMVAPAANTMVPGANQTGAGGWEVAALGNLVLVVVQACQTLEWKGHKFDRDRWGPWIMIALGFSACWFLWIWIPSQAGIVLDATAIQKGVLNGAATIYNAFMAFGPWSKLGVASGQVKS